MILPWRLVGIGDGPPISTSLTENETRELQRLAAGRRVIEVGAAYGYSTVVLAQVALQVTSIDPHVTHNSLQAWWHNLDHYNVADKVVSVVGRSIDAFPHLPGPYDLAFIDGDHTAEGVAFDVRFVQSLLAQYGCIAVHDYGEETCPDVRGVCDRLLPGGQLVDTLWVWHMG